jgi:prepilin-type N-terminal cleavage/methylation domain-containing protein
MKRSRGFSLIELLLVATVILIIAAIAIPNFLQSRSRANEASAVASMRVIYSSAVAYSMTYPDVGYPPQLLALGGVEPCSASSTSACLLDDVLSQGSKGGYTFTWTGDGATPSINFTLTGTRQVVGTSGQRQFCTDQSGLMHYDPSGAGCDPSSSDPLQ